MLRQWPKLQKLLAASLGNYSTSLTTGRGDATKFARTALKEGYNSIAAIGGDGTINEVVNGFFENGRAINAAATLGIIAAGTGCDLSRTLQIPENFEESVLRIAAGRTRACDVGKLSCKTFDDQPTQRYFVNIADAGFGGALVHRLARSNMLPGHFCRYLAGLLGTAMEYKNLPMRVEIDGTRIPEQMYNSVVIANGQFFGGGMWIAPDAKIDDGFFQAILIGDISRREIIANLLNLYNGKLGNHSKVKTLRAKKITVASDAEVLVDADGELPGKLPATFEILPSALKVIV